MLPKTPHIGTKLKIGFLTIGQSPRVDITGDLPKSLGCLEVVEAGALDDLSAEQIELLKPKQGETVYVSRLRDGSRVLLAKERLVPLLQEKIKLLHRGGVDVIVLVCSGEFDLEAEGTIVFPSRILRDAVKCLVKRKGKLGILVPEETQIQDAVNEWSELAEVRVLSLSPYVDSLGSLQASAKALRAYPKSL